MRRSLRPPVGVHSGDNSMITILEAGIYRVDLIRRDQGLIEQIAALLGAEVGRLDAAISAIMRNVPETGSSRLVATAILSSRALSIERSPAISDYENSHDSCRT